MLVGNPADWVVRASDPRVVTAVARQRVAEDRRGVQPDVRVLRHPELARQAALAHRRRRRAPRPSGWWPRGAVELNLISQDTVAWGATSRARPEGRRAVDGAAPTAAGGPRAPRRGREGGALGAPLLPLSGDARRRARRAPREAPARRAVCRHAPAARVRRDAQADAARPRQGPPAARRRATARKVPGLTFRTAFIVGHPGETDAEFDELCEFVAWARFEHVGVFRYSDEETCAAHGDRRQGPGAGRGEPRPQAHGAPARHRAREEPRPRRARARGARRGAERGARARDEGPARGAGARRSTAACT